MACIEELVPSLNLTPHKRRAAQDVYDRNEPQHRIVYDFMERGFSVTQMEAAIFWMDFRLADSIYRLKRKNYYLESEFKVWSQPIETSRGVEIAKYHLVPETYEPELFD